MGLTTAFLKAWRSHSRTDRTEFISQNLHYATSEAIAKHVEAYLFDILDEIDTEYVAQGCATGAMKSSRNKQTMLRNPLYCKHYCQMLCLKEGRSLDCIGFDKKCKDYEKDTHDI